MENPYRETLRKLEDAKYLIGMVSPDGILRLGFEMGLRPGLRVLDLCCGYGTVLKLWREAFGVEGVGVDICESFIEAGRKRLADAGADGVTLIAGDALLFRADEKFDVVIMSETFESVENTLRIGEKYMKEGGALVYHRLYSRAPEPPRAMLDFDGDVPTLPTLYERLKRAGYYLIAMASDTDADWERYVLCWSGQRNLQALRERPQDADAAAWADKWHRVYFESRRAYEGQAMFALVRR